MEQCVFKMIATHINVRFKLFNKEVKYRSLRFKNKHI